MSAKTSPARRAAFLKALGETGNHTLAAAHAKVSRSWVTLHKTSDPEFRAACEAAVAGAATRAQEASAVGGSRGAAVAADDEAASIEVVRAQILRKVEPLRRGRDAGLKFRDER